MAGRTLRSGVLGAQRPRCRDKSSLARRGDRRRPSDVREVSAAEAGPVLKRYVAVATPTRPYFSADKDAPVEDFVAEADRHPGDRTRSDR